MRIPSFQLVVLVSGILLFPYQMAFAKPAVASATPCATGTAAATDTLPADAGIRQGGRPMPRHVIRVIPFAHCKRGPADCSKCKAGEGMRISLLDISPPDQGMVQRRVIEVTIDGKKLWREFDVVRSFADEAEARAYAAANGITDLVFTQPGRK